MNLLRLLGVLFACSSVFASLPAGQQTTCLPLESFRCGETIEGGVFLPGGKADYLFVGNFGDRLHIGVEDTSGTWTPRVEILDFQCQDLGLTLTNGSNAFRAERVLPQSGFFILRVVDNFGSGTGTFRFRVDWLNGLFRCGERIGCGDYEIGMMAGPVAPSIYHFEGEAGDVVSLGIQELNGQGFTPGTRLFDPLGDLVSEGTGQGNFQTVFTLERTGVYTLSVSDAFTQGGIGAHQVFLDWLSPSEDSCAPQLGCGDIALGETLSPRDLDLYRFLGEEGDVVRIDVLTDAGTSWDAVARVYSPDGEALGTAGPHRVVFLPADGTYHIAIVDGTSNGFGKHRTQLEWLFPTNKACAPVLECGVPHTGSVRTERDVDYLAFDGSQGDRIKVSVRGGLAEIEVFNPGWQILAPSGQRLAAAPGTNDEFDLPEDGRYLIQTAHQFQQRVGTYEAEVVWLSPSPVPCSLPEPPPSDCVLGLMGLYDLGVEGLAPTPDLDLLLDGGRPVAGLGADGVTEVLVRMEGFSGPGQVRLTLTDPQGRTDETNNGILHDPLTGLTGNPLTLELVQRPGTSEWVGLAKLTAPMDFSRGERDREAVARELVLTVANAQAPGPCSQGRFFLFRPPTLLVHGWLGVQETWQWRTLLSDRGPRWDLNGSSSIDLLLPRSVYAHDYRLTHADRPEESVIHLRRGIEDTLRLFRGARTEDLPLAATQVDVVAHSMGGIVTRLYASDQNGDYYRADNRLRGDIHKLVTLGTPHFGSPWATLIQGLLDTPLLGDAIAAAAEAYGICLDCGAVDGLRPGVLQSIAAARVPSHAVVGTGGTDLISAGRPIPERRFKDEVSWVSNQLAFLRGLTGLDLSAAVFGDEPHDLLVAEQSARAGLGDGQVSYVGDLDGLHTYMQNSWVVEQHVRQLLDAPLSQAPGSGAFAPLLPAGPSALARQIPVSLPDFFAFFGLVSISLRSPQTDVQQGDIVLVEVGGSPLFSPDWVVVFGGDKPEFKGGPPFIVPLEIPPGVAVGHTVFAVAFDSSTGALAVSATLPISFNFDSGIEVLRAAPDHVFLTPDHPTVQLAARAYYQDLAVRHLDPDDPALSFSSLDPSVASVDGEGRVAFVAPGATEILLSYGSESTLLPVTVTATPADDGRALALRHPAGRNVGGFELGGSAGGRPVLGESIDLAVDPSVSGNSLAVVFWSPLPSHEVLASSQVVTASAAESAVLASFVGASTITMPIPNQASLSGMRSYLQAVFYGGGAPTSYASGWDLRFGTQ